MRALRQDPFFIDVVREGEEGVPERPVERVPGCLVTGATHDGNLRLLLRVPEAHAGVFARADRLVREQFSCTHGPWDPDAARLLAVVTPETRIVEHDGSEAAVADCLPRRLGDRTVPRQGTAVVGIDRVHRYRNQYTWTLLSLELVDPSS